MNTPQLLLTLFGCGLVTYLTRMPTLVFAGKWKIPEKARRFMSYIGPSILTALIVPSVFLTDAGFDPNPLTNLYILPAAVVIAVSFFFGKSRFPPSWRVSRPPFSSPWYCERRLGGACGIPGFPAVMKIT